MKKIVLSVAAAATLLAGCAGSAEHGKPEPTGYFKADTRPTAKHIYDSLERAGVIAKPASVTVAKPVVADTVKAQPAEAAKPVEQPKTDPLVAKGKTLIAGSDCLTCHKLDIKVVGPAYKDVAKKYTEADMDKLVSKIINGGAGNWGQIPMVPHMDLSPADAKAMVKYILSLK